MGVINHSPLPCPSPTRGEGNGVGYSIAQNVHAWIHDRHRMHFSGLITAGVFFSHVIASVGHAFLQRPHILHFSALTRNLIKSVQTRAGHRFS